MTRTDSCDMNEDGDLFAMETTTATEDPSQRSVKTVKFHIGHEEDFDDEVDHTNSTESDGESSDSRDRYPHGLWGSTPPRNDRYIKQSKRHRPSLHKASPGPVSLREKRQTTLAHNRVQSAVMEPEPDSDNEPEPQATRGRRHTCPNVPAYVPKVVSDSAEVHHSEEESNRKSKKKHTVARNKERSRKEQLKSPPTSDPSKLSPIPVRDGRAPFLKATSERSFSFDAPLPADSDDLMASSLNPLVTSYLHGCVSPPHSIERSKSDAQLSLALHSGHTIHCPSERKQFYRHFTKALKVYSLGQTLQLPHVPRQRSEDLSAENPMGAVMEQVWVELRANLEGLTATDFAGFQVYHNWEVDKVLDQIIHFRFEPSQESISEAAFTSVDRDDYEILNSLTTESVTTTLPLSTAMEVPTKEDYDDGEEEDYEHGPSTLTQHDSSDDQPATLTERDDPRQPGATLAQQESTDSDSSHHRDNCCESQFLGTEQRLALAQVKELLHRLDQVQTLYSTSRKMGDEHAKYRTSLFKRRHDALVLWSKITEGLASHLCRLSKWIGVTIRTSYEMQMSFEGHTSSSPSQATSRSSTNGSSVLLRRAIFTQSSVSAGSDMSTQNPEESLLLTQSSVMSSTSGRSQTTLQRLFSRQYPSSLDDIDPLSGYNKFVERTLKKKGLRWLVHQLDLFSSQVLSMAEIAMYIQTGDEERERDDDNGYREERKPLLHIYKPQFAAPVKRATSTSPLCWVDEFSAMNLPSFSQLYLQLARVPLDLMHECIRMQLESNKNYNEPSKYSVRQLVHECRLILLQAVAVRSQYSNRAWLLTANNPGSTDLVSTDIARFEEDLKKLLEVYFSYVPHLVEVNLLQEEWAHTKEICSAITAGELNAGNEFCKIACQLLESIDDEYKEEIDDCLSELHQKSSSEDEPEALRQSFIESCRDFKSIFQETREKAAKGLGFAKMLRKDLEIAAEFSIRCDHHKLLESLQRSDHVQVIIPLEKKVMVFVPRCIADSTHNIKDLLSVSFSSSCESHHLEWRDSYLLLVNLGINGSHPQWEGNSVHLVSSAETILSVIDMSAEGIRMIVQDNEFLSHNRMSFLRSMGNTIELSNERTSSHQSIADSIDDLNQKLCLLAHTIMETVGNVNNHLSIEDISEREDLFSQYRPTMQACFNLGFEFLLDVSRLLGEEQTHRNLGLEMLQFAQGWMIFVLNKCSRGHGIRPRWATLGLEFLALACVPRMLATMDDRRFESLKKQMEKCLDHIIGERPLVFTRQDSPFSSPGSKYPSTSWRRKPPLCTQSLRLPRLEGTLLEEEPDEARLARQISLSTSSGSNEVDSPTVIQNGGLHTEHAPYLSEIPRASGVSPFRFTSTDQLDSTMAYYSSPIFTQTSSSSSDSLKSHDGEQESRRMQLLRERIKDFDKKRETQLLRQKRIGTVTDRGSASIVEVAKLANLRQTHFNWRRGRKLGEGQFGKVYECFNMDRAETNAVKVISLQERNTNTVRDIINEVNVYRSIVHKNIVRLRGVEIQHNELYLFMEYCDQGTLWSASKHDLPERMVRRYTRDIVCAVDALHEKDIVHRDIKGANIFLSRDSVKLGDFGLSVQLKNVNKTQPNEIKHQRGTIPYMAPEVILKQNMGRSMDVWAIGCVVVEMITSKLPWADYEDNIYAIMYKLGQGSHPPYPDKLVDEEASSFLNACFKPNPDERATTGQLLTHPFVKVLDDDMISEI